TSGARLDPNDRWRRCDMVASAHPDVQLRLAAMVAQDTEQSVMRDQFDCCMTELTRVGGLGAAAQLRGKRLHAVADAQDRQPAIEDLLWRARGIRSSRRLRATGQDDALRAERRDLVGIVVPGPDLAIDADLADAARDQLGVLRPEVEDEQLV